MVKDLVVITCCSTSRTCWVIDSKLCHPDVVDFGSIVEYIQSVQHVKQIWTVFIRFAYGIGYFLSGSSMFV